MMSMKEFRSASDKFEDNFDLETSDRSRLQSLQPLDFTSCALTDSTLEDPFSRTQKPGGHMSAISEVITSLSEDKLSHEDLSMKLLGLYSKDLLIQQKLSFISENSDLTSEDLIINENIDFLLDSSNEKGKDSVSLDFTYTITENSMLTDTFNWKSALMKSLPESKNNSYLVTLKSFVTLDPSYANERLDLHDKIEKMDTEGGLFTEKSQFPQTEIRKENEYEDTVERENQDYEAEMEIENDQSRCSCDSCSIM